MKHRREIDGLRAFAVVPVVLFHTGINAFSGGFVGVDVFFVISGYLITSLIAEECAAGRFSIRRFYERRARRILPALYVVLLACVPFAGWLMMPDELANFGANLAAVVTFVSNIRFWFTTDYFSAPGALDPLLHTWSLAVEEQHYLLFPALMIGLWRFGRRRVFLGVALLSAASFVGAEFAWPRWPMANFLLLPTRIWELGVGALAGLFLTWRPDWRAAPPLAEAGGLLGIAMIVGASLVYTEATPFPSRYALVPTLGAVAVILFARPRTVAGQFLGLRPFVWLGLLSYSAYLWHQPLFAFARLGAMEAPGRGLMLVLTVVTFGLAALTWRWVEQPFRNRDRIGTAMVWKAAAASSAVILACAAIVPRLSDPSGYPAATAQFMVPLAVRKAYVDVAYKQLEARGFANDGRPKALLIGDSHSQDFYNVVRELGAFDGYDLTVSYVAVKCQIYLGPDLATHVAPGDLRTCQGGEGTEKSVARAEQADVVVFISNWKPWAAAALPATLKRYGFRPEQKVIVVGPKSFRAPNLRRLRSADPATFPALRHEQTWTLKQGVEAIRSAAPPALLVDIQALACGPTWSCPVFTPSGELISFDGSHLTQAGARWLGPILFADPRLAPYAPRKVAQQ